MRSMLFVCLFPFILLASDIKDMRAFMQYKPERVISFLPAQYRELREAVSHQRDKKKPVYTILYFFSVSVPEISFANHLVELAKFNRDHQVRLDGRQILIGINKDLHGFLSRTHKYLQGLGDDSEEKALVDIRLAPEVYEELSLSQVPALALANCPPKAHPSECKILAIAKGDVSLSFFFDLLKDNHVLPKELQ